MRQNKREGRENLIVCISLEFSFLNIISVAQVELTVYWGGNLKLFCRRSVLFLFFFLPKCASVYFSSRIVYLFMVW